MIRRASVVATLTLALCLLQGPGPLAGEQPRGSPAGPTDREFWRIIEEMSELDGYFDSDNLVSNEDTFQSVIPRLTSRVAAGGAYIGVGPDQNFTYLAALRPAIAFIVDIRRGNLHVHLMYKAVIELSADRADFLSRLFSRPRPPGLARDASAGQLLQAYDAARPDRGLYARNLEAIFDLLVGRHRFPLTDQDRAGVAYVYSRFFDGGPDLTFESSRAGTEYPTYRSLQTSTDDDGVNRGYLGSEATYGRLRTLQLENRIVPIVGNFAGRRALRSVGTYVRSRGGTVTAFYTSNVEQYLFRDRAWHDFAANVGALPLDGSSTFIRACFNLCSSPGGSRSVTLLGSIPELMRAVAEGRVRTYPDVLSRSGASVSWGLPPR